MLLIKRLILLKEIDMEMTIATSIAGSLFVYLLFMLLSAENF